MTLPVRSPCCPRWRTGTGPAGGSDHSWRYGSEGGDVPMKIVVLDGQTTGLGADAWDGLRQLGDLELYDRSSPEEVAARARSAGVLITNKAPVTAETIGQAPVLRFIALLATGFDPVD